MQEQVIKEQVVQIDTIYHKVEVVDSVFTRINAVVNDTIKPDLISVYENLIVAQDNKFDYLLTVGLIIIFVLILLFTLYNLQVGKVIFKKQALKIFNRNKDKLYKEVRDMETRMLELSEANLHFSTSALLRLQANSVDSFNSLKIIFDGLKIYSKYSLETEIKNTLKYIYDSICEMDKSGFKEGYFNFAEYMNALNAVPYIEDNNEIIIEIKRLLFKFDDTLPK